MDIVLGRFKISGAALLALSAVYFFDVDGLALPLFVALAVHEAGHLLAMRCMGRRLTEFRIDLWGLTIRYDNPLSYVREIITASAGPLFSLLLAFSASFIGRYTSNQMAFIIAGISLLCCVFNLLPVMKFDGGKILFAAVALSAGLERAEKLLCVTSCVVIGVLLTGGAALLLWTRINFSLLLAGVWLLISYCKREGIRIKSKGINVGSV